VTDNLADASSDSTLTGLTVDTDPRTPRGPDLAESQTRARHRRRGAEVDDAEHLPRGLSPWWRRILIVTLILQMVVVATVAVVIATQFKLWAPIDEDAHFSYIQQIAEHGSLPVLGRTEISLQALAIRQGIYPRATTIDPKKFGLGGLSYEAWQPPLYYIVAAPVFDIPSSYVHKAYAVRVFDILLFFAAIALTGRLCRLVLRDRWLIGWSMTLVFFALPGVVVRVVTISYLALALPLAILFACELWTAWHRHSPRRLALAGVVLGLCVLTELELLALIPVYLLVVFVEALRRRQTRRFGPLLVALAVPFVIMAPWFAFNEANYHMLTAGPISQREVAAVVNPHGINTPISQLPDQTVALLEPVLPAEWGSALDSQQALTYVAQLLDLLIIPAGLVLVLGLGRRLWSVPVAILALPWVITIIELWYVVFVQQSQAFSRYTYPTVPILLVLVALSTENLQSRYLPIVVNGLATGSLVALWGYLIFGYTGSWALVH